MLLCLEIMWCVSGIVGVARTRPCGTPQPTLNPACCCWKEENKENTSEEATCEIPFLRFYVLRNIPHVSSDVDVVEDQ